MDAALGPATFQAHFQIVHAACHRQPCAPRPADVARAMRQVIEAPAGVDTKEITIQPTASAN